MASGFFALLDDIALLMDDVATLSKVATKKTAGILGDDLAVNAEKATGFRPSRELPVLWTITKGSFLNKVVILPLAFLLSAYAAWLLEPILIAGGGFLAYEGVEKIWEHLRHKKTSPQRPSRKAQDKGEDWRKAEKAKVKSAILVDFILSIEIVLIALSTVMDAPLPQRIGAVTVVAVLATIGVYGLVAVIVRMDDAGLALMDRDEKAAQTIGAALVRSLPVLIKIIGAFGTAALVLVSGGIFMHHIPAVHHVFSGWPSLPAEILAGLVGGALVFAGVSGIRRLL